MLTDEENAMAQKSYVGPLPAPPGIIAQMHEAQSRMLKAFGMRSGEGGPHSDYVTGYAAAIADLIAILTRTGQR